MLLNLHPKQRNLLFSLLKTEEEGDVLFELGEEIQQDLVSNISNEELIEAVKELELDEDCRYFTKSPRRKNEQDLIKYVFGDRKESKLVLHFQIILLGVAKYRCN